MIRMKLGRRSSGKLKKTFTLLNWTVVKNGTKSKINKKVQYELKFDVVYRVAGQREQFPSFPLRPPQPGVTSSSHFSLNNKLLKYTREEEAGGGSFHCILNNSLMTSPRYSTHLDKMFTASPL